MRRSLVVSMMYRVHDLIRREHAHRMTMRRVLEGGLQEHATELLPGIYLQRAQVLRHWRYRLPRGVVSAKGGGLKWRSRVLQLAMSLARPWRPLRNPRGSGRGASLLISNESGDRFVLVAPEHGWIQKIWTEAKPDERYVHLREQFSTYVCAPAFTVDIPSGRLREQYIDGTPLALLAGDVRIEHVKRLLRSLAVMIQSEANGSVSGWFEDVMRSTEGVRLPKSLQRTLDWDRLAQLVGVGPFAPSHGDVGPGNILIADDEPVLLDWSPRGVDERPFWCDGVHLAMRSQDLGFWSGTLDEELELIWSAAGRTIDIAASRLELAVAWTVCRPPQHWFSIQRARSKPLETYIRELWSRIDADQLPKAGSRT